MTHFVKDTLPNGKSFDRPIEHLPEYYSDPLSMENIVAMKFSPTNRLEGIKYVGEDKWGFPNFEVELKFPFENFEQELALDYWESFKLETSKFIVEDDGVRFFATVCPYYGAIFDVAAFFHEVGTGYTAKSTPGYEFDCYEYIEHLDGKIGDATNKQLEELIYSDGILKTFTTPDGREWRLLIIVHED